MVQMDIFYMINWILGKIFDTYDLRSYKYYQLHILLLRSTNFYLNIFHPNEPLYLVY